ncbi:MAG: hypothetical protein A2033_13945 [Bacteroidetes bacterium GWA2_31_9]|nr:MAG: hypothetical protein A2033_13945 [Bacteroidetes bacterium GWA2_31_9]
MKFEPEFKRAISQLPSAEKDKLIFRLLKYDLVLANRLNFELLSSKNVDERRAEMEIIVKTNVEKMTNYFHSPGYLMMDMRYLSGEITTHVKTTKDKFGEISLNLLMLNEVLRLNNKNIDQSKAVKSYKFCIYVIARAFKILILINALHEDYRIEFNDNLINLGELISESNYLMQTAIRNGFDVNWLLKADIPKNINEIHRKIRNEGFLV